MDGRCNRARRGLSVIAPPERPLRGDKLFALVMAKTCLLPGMDPVIAGRLFCGSSNDTLTNRDIDSVMER